MKKEDTAVRKAQRKYEEAHMEERKAKSGTFSTYMPRKELDEINEFLKKNNISKVELIRKGFEVLKGQFNNNNCISLQKGGSACRKNRTCQ